MRRLYTIILLLLLLAAPAPAAISQATLSTKLQTNISAVLHAPVDTAQLKKVCDAIALAVVNEIQTNAVVTVTSVSGVTSGPSASGPGTGTVQ